MIGFGRESNDFQKFINKKTDGIYSEDAMSQHKPDEGYMRQESSASTNLDLDVLSIQLMQEINSGE